MKTKYITLRILAVIIMVIMAGCQPAPASIEAPSPTNTSVPTSVPTLVAVRTGVPATQTSAAPVEATQGVTETAPKHGGTLTVIHRVSPKSLVPYIDAGKAGIGILRNTQDGLLNLDAAYTTIYPALAVDFPDHPDPLTYVFHLRKGVLFHSGNEFKCVDAKWAFDLQLDPQYGATYAGEYALFLKSVECTDDYTIVFHLKIDWPLFYYYVAADMVTISEKAVNTLPDGSINPEYGNTIWSGTGPFMITEWVKGDYVRVVRNPHYWAAGKENLPYLDEVIFKEIPDPSAMYAALDAGQGDVLDDPDLKDVQGFQTAGKYQVFVEASPASTLIIFNTARAPFDNELLRQAIDKAIDRQEIVDTLFFGFGDVGTDFFPPFHWAHDPSITRDYDPEGAKALLKQAGYDASNPFKFTLMTRSEPAYSDQAVLIQDQMKRIGVEMEVLPMEYTTLSGMTQGAPSEWSGDAALYRITPVSGSAFEFTYSQYGAGGGLNRTYFNKPDQGGFVDQEFETKLKAAILLSDYDPAQRALAFPLYSELSKMWIKDAPGLVLNWWANADIAQPYVRGWVPAVADFYLEKDVWLDK
jgi:peptide/nickel transport system substrate-binding protein